jgi:kinesin family protein C1
MNRRTIEEEDDDEDVGPGGKRKGMPYFSNSPTPSDLYDDGASLRYSKLRGAKSAYTLQSTPSVQNFRDVSVSTALSRLRIGDDEPPKLRHKLSLRSAMKKSDLNSKCQALMMYNAPSGSPSAPKTPSHIPILMTEAPSALPVIPLKFPKTPPCKTPYLSKDSNIPAFTAWDVRGRLEDMEAMYSELKTTLSGSNMERNGLEEAVKVYKSRSKISFQLYGMLC